MPKNKLHITQKLIQDYLEGKLKPKEAYALERRALVDQEISDMLSGAEKFKELELNRQEIRTSLAKNLHERLKEEKRPKVLWIRAIGIAATIAIVGAVSWFMINSLQKPENLAKVESSPAPEATSSEEENESKATLAMSEPASGSTDKKVPTGSDERFRKQQNEILSDQEDLSETEAISSNHAEPPAPVLLDNDFAQATSEELSKAKSRSTAKTLPTQSVRGRVVDELDDPLPGALIQNKANGIKRITDVNGAFEIPIGTGKDLLLVQYVGFENKELKAEKVNEEIVLLNDSNALSEVVVTQPSIDQKASPQVGWRVLNEERKINSDENGKIQVSFEIDERGRLENVEITKSFDPARNAQVLEILNRYDQWNPEFANGKPIKTKKKLTFKFLKKQD